MSIRLTYPEKSHKTEDLWPLYQEFKTDHATVFKSWYEIESNIQRDSGPEPLKEVDKAVREFLKVRVEWESNAALIGAFADFRRLIRKDMFDN